MKQKVVYKTIALKDKLIYGLFIGAWFTITGFIMSHGTLPSLNYALIWAVSIAMGFIPVINKELL